MKNDKKRKKYQKPTLEAIKIKDINVKAMAPPSEEGQFCMMTAGDPCHV